MDIINQYKEVFEAGFRLDSSVVEHHIERLKELDQILPPSTSFLMITNTDTQKYEFITRNFERATGLSAQAFYRTGIPGFISRVHPEEITLWLQMLGELMAYTMTEIEESDRIKLDYQYNYRIKHENGNYINLLENQVPLFFNESGKPSIGLGHFSVIGDGEVLPIKATIRKLNQNNEYETIYFKNFTQNLLTSGLTNRENDVVRLLALGHSSKLIGDKLHISPHTVDVHRKNILKKLNLNSTSEIQAYFQNSSFFG